MKSNVPIKISDIARLAKVSPSTVARVVHNNGYVAADKRRVIEELLNQQGYVPNKVAQGLRMKRTDFIGHVLPLNVENPIMVQIGTAFQEAAEQAGYHVLTAISRNSPEQEALLIRDMVGMMVEAIVFTTETVCDSSVIEWVLSKGIPIVMLERIRPIAGISAVLLDSFEGPRLAVNHFAQHGHRRIAFIGKETSRTVEHMRYEGYLQTMIACGLQVLPTWTHFVDDYTIDRGYAAMRAVYEAEQPPTAVFAASDLLACGAMQFLYEKGLRIPEDVSLIGHDNTLAALCAPPLTTIALSTEEVAQAAITLIREQLSPRSADARQITLTPRLVERKSVSNAE